MLQLVKFNENAAIGKKLLHRNDEKSSWGLDGLHNTQPLPKK